MQPIIFIENHLAFKSSLKKLKKKYITLDEDLGTLKKAAIILFHINNIDNYSVFEIPKCGTEIFSIFKVKKIACKALKGRGVKSGLRLIYAFNEKTGEITFLELYHKNQQECENKGIIKDFLAIV